MLLVFWINSGRRVTGMEASKCVSFRCHDPSFSILTSRFRYADIVDAGLIAHAWRPGSMRVVSALLAAASSLAGGRSFRSSPD